MFAEKRMASRVVVLLTAHCRIGNRFVRERISDLSVGGLFLTTREAARAGTPVRVALALPDDRGPHICTLIGSVTRVERDGRGLTKGLGVCFSEHETTEGDRLALHAFLTRQTTLG